MSEKILAKQKTEEEKKKKNQSESSLPSQNLRDPIKSFKKKWCSWVIAISAFLCYLNSLTCGLVFDDQPAIRDNMDVRPTTRGPICSTMISGALPCKG
ncbi:hypothetical protein CEXT_423211 [Caerostris extrusa]|uniref:Uncharacterized protein n=1 Tax=Caerostris extrusa TaxID=172846 RepID=A0AAV4RBN9_CAEEX|nr:hypothetical protein CEXT_423211 [Caerostris extrusa]